MIREAYTHFVGVHPDYRNMGIAKQLYETFFGKVHELGCSTVRDYEGEGQHYIGFSKRITTKVLKKSHLGLIFENES